MTNRIVAWLLKCYPSAWRLEYGAEMEDLLGKGPLTLARIWNVFCGALRERVRQPGSRFIYRSVLAWVGLFICAVSCSQLMWRLVAAPVAQVLIHQRIDPPNLLATSPWEGVLIIWLGIPLLLTVSAFYPVVLVFACRGFATPPLPKAIAAVSAALYGAGFAAGFVAWQFGSFEWLVRLLLQSQKIQVVSLTQCFGLLAASTLGSAVVLQVPLVLLHAWHSAARGH